VQIAPENEAYFHSIATGPWASPDHPAHRVAAALRRLAAVALAGPPDPSLLAELGDRLEAVAPPAGPEGSRYASEHLPGADGTGRVQPNANGTHPLVGPCNPVAPPIVLRLGDGVVHGDVVYDVRFEGLPGLVQGGFIAAAFDVMLGQGVALTGWGGMTGSLTIRFLAPTPLHRPLRYEGWSERQEGRKSFARARLVRLDDGTVCAEAEGVFISPRTRGAQEGDGA
jgi:acyl-coenzyme A thioesterase PaaI-like protein